MRSLFTGDMSFKISPDGYNSHAASVHVVLLFDVSADGEQFTLLSGWPTVSFDNSLPPFPASRALRISLASASPGVIDSAGRVTLPILLNLDREPNLFLGEQDLNLDLVFTSSSSRIWDDAPNIGLSGSAHYFPGHDLEILMRGSFNPLPVSYPVSEKVWFDGALPYGASGSLGANSIEFDQTSCSPCGSFRVPLPPGYPPPFDGRPRGVKCFASYLRSKSETTTSENAFRDAKQTLTVAHGERLFAYVYLRPEDEVHLNEIMLQWNDGSWEHRAFWGADVIPLGVAGTVSRRRVGDLPQRGEWTRLEVPARDVGLEGRTLNGMEFTVNGVNGPVFYFSCLWSRAGSLHEPKNWEEIGHANDVVAMTATDAKLFAATRDHRLLCRNPVTVAVDWEEVGHANYVVAMAASDGMLFAATSDHRLWWRHAVCHDVNWVEIGRADDVVAMAALNGKLFAATRNNRLQWRDAVGTNIGWADIGHANDVVAMTAIDGRLFAATRDHCLWLRDPVGTNVNWSEIGHAPDVVAMAAASGMLFAVTSDHRLQWRHPLS